MITYFIFDILPVFFRRIENVIEESGIYTLMKKFYRLIYRLVHKSILGKLFCLHENEGSVYENSIVCRFFDSAIKKIVYITSKIVSFFSSALKNSLLYFIISKVFDHYRFLDYEFICGAVIFIMFLCPGQYWHNIYALIFSVFLLVVLTILCALKKKETLRIKTLGLPFVVFVFATIVGVGIARNFSDAMRVFIFFLSAFLFCIVIAGTATDEKKLNKILGAIYISLLSTAIIGFAQRLIGVEASSALTDLTLNQGMPGRVFSTFENPNNYAEIIVLMFPLALTFCTTIKNRAMKLLSFGGLCLSIGALLMTYSRSGWVSFAIAAIVFIFFYNKKLLPIVFVLGILCIPLLPQSIYNRLLTIGSTRDSSNMYRLYIWDAVLQMLEKHGIIGVGLGPANFRPDYLTYTIPKSAPASHSHMLYLEVWIEMGLIGIIGYLTYYFSTIRRSVVNLKNSSKLIRLTLISGVASLAGISFVCAAEYIWFYPRVLFSFFILMGVISAAININNKENTK